MAWYQLLRLRANSNQHDVKKQSHHHDKRKFSQIDIQPGLVRPNASYRDAAKADNGLSHQLAYDITFAFELLGFIKIVDKGKAGSNGGKAAEFRYLAS